MYSLDFRRVTKLLLCPIFRLALVGGLVLLAGCGEKEAETDLDGRLDELRAVPYTHVSDKQADEEASGVVIHDPDRAYRGYNIFCGVTPHVYLMDMNGEVVHFWTYPEEKQGLWHHAIMLEDGSVVIVNMYNHVLKLDWNSSLVWKQEMYVHHDVAELDDGSFHIIGVEVWTYRGLAVRFPTIVTLNCEGEELASWSAYEHLDHMKQIFDTRPFLDTILDSMLAQEPWLRVYNKIAERDEVVESDQPGVQYDHFHMNTITVLPDSPLGRSDDRFKQGNLLTCFRNVNQIAVQDGDTKEVLWTWGEGILEWPHHPTMVSNGNILVFDNGIRRRYSKVIELNPPTGEIEWEYTGIPPESFFSKLKGSAQRLPNGNTFICEGDRGRAFEVTPDGEIVWEWLNPLKKGKRRVTVYRMMRLSPEAVEFLLEKASEKP
jgi:hypothetical protein